MSNNIYDILKTMRGLDSPKATLTEGKKAKPDFLDLNKNGNKTEPMEKAAKEKRKGAIAEAVARVEQHLAEKYMGFKKTAAGKKLGEATAPNRAGQRRLRDALEDDPDMMGYHAIAALYGNDMWDNDAMGDLVNDLEQANPTPKELQYIIVNAKLPTRLKGIRFTNTDDVQFGHLGEESESGMTKKVIPVGVIDGPGGYEEAQKRIKDYEAGKINKDGKPLPPVDDRSRPALNIVSRHDGVPPPAPAEKPKNEDMLSPKKKKIDRMSPPPNKIDANDLAALRDGKKKKQEGNAFSGALDAAKKAGQEKFSVDGKEYQVKEGFDELLKAQQERSGPQPRGGSGIKQGTRYGGGRQTDDPDTDNETGEVAKKGRGRPKKDKFAK